MGRGRVLPIGPATFMLVYSAVVSLVAASRRSTVRRSDCATGWSMETARRFLAASGDEPGSMNASTRSSCGTALRYLFWQASDAGGHPATPMLPRRWPPGSLHGTVLLYWTALPCLTVLQSLFHPGGPGNAPVERVDLEMRKRRPQNAWQTERMAIGGKSVGSSFDNVASPVVMRKRRVVRFR